MGGDDPLRFQVPTDAAHFAVFRIRIGRKRDEQGNSKSHTTFERMRGEPLEDGTVPQSWPIAEFSVPNILAHWGSGRYRIDFFMADGTRIKAKGHVVEVAEPAARSRGPKLAKPKKRIGSAEPVQGEDEPDRRPETMSAWDVMELLDRREQRAIERMRAEYALKADQDRQFMSSMMQMAQGRQAAGTQSAEGVELLRREVNVTLQEGLFKLRKDLVQAAITREEQEEPDDDPADGPQDLSDGAERIGLRVLKELEDRAPELIEELIPNVVEWLKRKGFVPSPELAAHLNGQARANGQ